MSVRIAVSARGESAGKEAGDEKVREEDKGAADEPAKRDSGGKDPLARIVPDSGDDEVDEGHGKHEFPGEVQELIDAESGQRATCPDEQRDHGEEFQCKPDRTGSEIEETEWRQPTAEKERNAEAAHGEEPEIFGKKKERIFETGVFRKITGDDFRFGFRNVEGRAVGSGGCGDKKQNKAGKRPRGEHAPCVQKYEQHRPLFANDAGER